MSKGRPVTSGIAQGLVLRPASFNVFVGDMNSGIEALKKFADSSNLCGKGGSRGTWTAWRCGPV